MGSDGGGDDVSGADRRLRVQVLGSLRVVRGGSELDLRGPRSRLLLAILVISAGRPVSYGRLVDDVYGEDPPTTARKSIQVHVSNLRRELGGGVIVTTSDGYQLVTDLLVIDAVEFAQEVESAGALLDSDPALAGERLSAALARWVGMPFGDLAHEPAVRAEAVRLSELRLRAAEMRIDADLRLGRHAHVLGELEVLTTDHPYSEELRALQMIALYRSGRQAQALRVFSRTRSLLVDELGVEPGARLRLLEQQILEQSTELDFHSRPMSSTGFTHAIRGFELRERLGAGGSGTVYRAYQPSVGREVAVRVIRPELANQPDFVRRFEAEAQFIAQLDHPNLVPLHDYWRDPSGAYLVMAHLGGGSLARALARGSWSPSATLRLLDQIGPAVAHAHRHGMVHGALKPTSVLLDGDGNAYLADLGVNALVGVTGHRAGGTDSGSTAGVAPEQTDGRPPDARSDQYCLALLILETLTGRHPQPDPSGRPVGPDDDVPAEMHVVLQRACAIDPSDRFERVEDFMRAVRRAFGADVLSSPTPAGTSEVRNPFKGLRAFTEVDADDFHGRGALVEDVLDVVRSQSVTVVIGPSGSGKSSLVKAGLLPAVRAGRLGDDVDWMVTDMFPDAHPFEELEASLCRVAVDRPAELLADLEHDDRGLLRVAKQILPGDASALLLVVDQFEELFSLVTDEHVRSRFLDCLVAVAEEPRSRVKVVVTMRADFFDRPLRYPAFGEVLQRGLVQVAMPSEQRMAEAIGVPIRSAGLDVEPGLIPTIVADVAGQPGGLPLLQFALTELVDRREGRMLTMTAYQASGGVSGALGRRAEQIFQDLPPAGRRAARDVFLRLVAVTDDGDIGRRRIRRSELSSMPIGEAGLTLVIAEYGAFRLLSFDHDPVTRGPTVEVSHEALMDAWPRFRDWIAEYREDLLLAHRLEVAAREWADGGREPSFLLRGGRFEQYRDWADAADLRLTSLETEYLEASADLAASLERERAASAHRDAMLRRRSRLLLASAVVAVVLAGLVATTLASQARARDEQRRAEQQARVAEDQRTAAEEQRTAAEEQRMLAETLTSEVALSRRAQALAADSRSVLATDPKLAASLASEAIRTTAELGTAEPQAVDALHFALQADGATFPTGPGQDVALRPGDDGLQGVFVLPVSDLVELAQNGHTRELTADECERYLGPTCPDATDNAPLDPAIEIVGGVAGYLELTDPVAPLTGARATIGGWYPVETWEVNAPAFDAVLDASGLSVGYEQVDVEMSVDEVAELDLVLYTELSWMAWAAQQGAIVDLAFLDPVDLDRQFGEVVASLGRLEGVGAGSDGGAGKVGATYAVPRTLTSQSTVLFRRDLFDERGYEVPATFEELVALSDRIVADGSAPWCFAGRWSDGRGGFPVTDWIEAFVLSGSGPGVYEAWARGDVGFTSEPVRQAFDRLGHLVFSDGYVGAGAGQIPSIDFYLPAFTMTGSEPTCLMTLATSIVLELVPRDALDLLDVFVLPTETPDGVERLVLGGNHWSMTADTPENRAVMRALLSREHAQVATGVLSSFVSPDIGFRYTKAGNAYETPEPSQLQLRLIELVHKAVREGRIVWDASDRMPLDFSRDAFQFAPTVWFETGPATLDELLSDLDAARGLAAR